MVIKLNDEELRKLQLIELEMLLEFDRVCRKNRINYSLDGGTAIGALRHRGFIPWDDDIDVMMTMDDYEKFYEASQRDLDTTKFFFQDHRTDPGYRWGYGKLRRIGTEYVKAGQEHMSYKTGVCIDIFNYENVPDGYISRLLFLCEIFIIRKILYSELGMVSAPNAVMRTVYKVLNIIPKEQVFLIKDRITHRNSSKKTEKMICTMMPFKGYELRYGIPSEIFDSYKSVLFEGFEVLASSKCEEYMRLHYGDYMQLPPVEERHGVLEASQLSLIDISQEYLQNKYQRK